MDDDYLFPDSTKKEGRKSGNIMDDLFGKSSTDDDFLFSNTKLSKTYDKQPSSENQYFSSNRQNDDVKVSTERRGRRGISPIVNQQNNQPKQQNDNNWLELKNDKKPSESEPKEIVAEQKSFLDWIDDKPPIKKQTSQENVTKRVFNLESGHNGATSQNKPKPSEQAPEIIDTKSVGSNVNAKSNSVPMNENIEENIESSSATIVHLRNNLKRNEYEKDQLLAELESMRSKHQEELTVVENSYKRRIKLTEESFERRERNLQDEVKIFNEISAENRKHWDKERSELVLSWQRRLDESNEQRIEDLNKMKQLHHQLLVQLQSEHGAAIEQLKKMRNFEMESVSDVCDQRKSIEVVIEQLKSNTRELLELQGKIQSGKLNEKELMMSSKDEQIKMLKEQVEKQRNEDAKLVENYQLIVNKLEAKLNEQTTRTEEEKWKLNEEKLKFEIERKSWLQERKLKEEQMEQEKQQLNKIKIQLMNEQKEILESKPREIPTLRSTNDIRAEIDVQSTLQFIQMEKEKLSELSAELVAEKRLLEVERAQLGNEKSSVDVLLVQLRQRSNEIEQMCLSAIKTREEGFEAAKMSLNFETELRKRSEFLWNRFEELKSKERHLAEERIKLAKDRKQIEILNQKLLCIKCQQNLAEIEVTRKPLVSMDWQSWRENILKDKQFLNNEKIFLQKLQSSSKMDEKS